MTISVAVAGSTGYAGSEFLRLLVGHPRYRSGELRIGALCAGTSAGATFGSLAPHITPLRDRVVEPTTVETLNKHDVVFLGLPHGQSAELAKQLDDRVIIIDSAADFRLESAEAWERYYGSPHAGCWTYGLPEMPGQKEKIRVSRQVALPGCFPTGATLATAPALANGLVAPEVVLTSMTGVSGAGKKAQVAMLGSETMGSLKAYNVGGVHRHTPEMVQNFSKQAATTVSVSFTPVLAPLQRGILTVASAQLSAAGLESDENSIRSAYQEFYADHPYVCVLEPGEQPQTQNVLGSNMCHVNVVVDSHCRRLLMFSAIDNLTKGTAGEGVQCMNLMLGWDETEGLAMVGVAP